MSAQPNIAHYRITGKLGEGGMGEVWRAFDTKLNREVAVKILPEAFARDSDRLARFTREAQVLASLNHPNIAAIYGVEERTLVMELVEGPTLAERIAQGPVPLDESLGIAKQIAEALEYAHQRGVVHRDLKPANIKVTPEGRVKVLDFGLAKAMSSDPVAQASACDSPTLTMRSTQAGVILGTAAYMAPEQARGHEVDKRADIWAFGVVMYEMLSGRRLFEGPTVSDTLAAVLTREPEWRGIPAPLRRLLRLCLTKDARHRLRDIGDAWALIEETPELDAVTPVHSRWRWWSIALAPVAAAGLVVALVHFREQAPIQVPVRFQIPAPEKASYGAGGMALSPDGHKLAFVATAPIGAPMLWLRSLDSLDARPLAGTEGAAYLPFWSPDSRFIAFGTSGRLKKIEASGGPAETLCVVPGNPLGGSWNRDGVILFSTNATPVLQVPQTGGVPTEVTKLGVSPGEIAHMRPWFLPDGRHFLYVSRGGANDSIYVAKLDGKPPKRLVDSHQAGAYAPPGPGSKNGHLLFLREGTLMAQPLDPESFELASEPFPLAQQVGSNLAQGFFTVSANGTLAYRSGVVAGPLRLIWLDREGKSLGTLGPAGIYANVGLSPDGKRVAAGLQDQQSARDVWLLDVSRGVSTRFTFSGRRAYPVWSLDGTRVALGAIQSGIFQKDSTGVGDEQSLFKSGVPESWSPDGKYLLYSDIDPKTNTDLWILPMTTTSAGDKNPAPYLRTEFSERQGQFSPDGRWVAYVSDESGQNQVYVQSFPAGAGKFLVSSGGGVQPRWRRDGKEIFYVGGDGKLMAVEMKTAPQFEVIGAPKALFDPHIPRGATSGFRYDVTGDGKRFLVISTSDASEPAAPITVVLNWQAGLKR